MSDGELLGWVLVACTVGWLVGVTGPLEAPWSVPEPEPTVLEKYVEVLEYCNSVGRKEIVPEPAIVIYCARLCGTSKTDI